VYYLTAGHVFDLDYNLKFKPAMMKSSCKDLQVDLSANFCNDKFTLEQHIAGVPH
jgi:hypothetical protein